MRGDLGPGDFSATRDSAGRRRTGAEAVAARRMRGRQLIGAVREGGRGGARSGGEALVPVVQAADLWQADHFADLGRHDRAGGGARPC